MRCEVCKSTNVNGARWAEIIVNGEYQSIGGDASQVKTKHDYAQSMKYTDYFNGYYNNKNIFVREYNHCWECGHSNKEKYTQYGNREIKQ